MSGRTFLAYTCVILSGAIAACLICSLVGKWNTKDEQRRQTAFNDISPDTGITLQPMTREESKVAAQSITIYSMGSFPTEDPSNCVCTRSGSAVHCEDSKNPDWPEYQFRWYCLLKYIPTDSPTPPPPRQ